MSDGGDDREGAKRRKMDSEGTRIFHSNGSTDIVINDTTRIRTVCRYDGTTLVINNDGTQQILPRGEIFRYASSSGIIEAHVTDGYDFDNEDDWREYRVSSINIGDGDGTQVTVTGHNDVIISGNSTEIDCSGSGSVTVNGNIGTLKVSGSKNMTVYGKVELTLVTSGTGVTLINGDIHGNIDSSGLGKVIVHGDVDGNINARGLGELTVAGDHLGSLTLSTHVKSNLRIRLGRIELKHENTKGDRPAILEMAAYVGVAFAQEVFKAVLRDVVKSFFASRG